MKVTITDIAKIANVSVATVSRVINNKSKGVSEQTRTRLLKLIEEYNFEPNAVARGLVTKKSKIIGLLIQDIANPFYPRLAKGVEEEANLRGYNIILCDGNNSEEKEVNYLDFLNKHYVAGIIYNNFNNIGDKILNIIVNNSIPLVFIDSKIDIPGIRCVYVENEKAIYELVSYLISIGHRKIGFITGPMDSYSTNERFKGYIKVLEDNQIPIDYDLIVEGDYTIPKGYETMGILLDRKTEMTVVVCCNDLMAIGAMEMLEERNIKVPDEMSIVGFDNIDMSRIVRPKLTTVSQPSYEMGRAAAKMLINIIENKSKKNDASVVFLPELVIRDSVKKLN
ncbi:MAG: LacI family transcriptional regulator [Firmicutes bacterium HGW-Firmicutes-7]|nr:MAG: LacI family transcriptional regulator [Firmicutes bacterium HGW-Firmicutes-7]